MDEIKEIKGGVCAAKGFTAFGLEIGIKEGHTGKKDMAMIYSERRCNVAGTFTSNLVKAAPVVWDMNIVEKSEGVHAVVVNSGIANAATGKQGMSYCEETAKIAAECLAIKPEEVLVGSTGVIGKQLPMDKIIDGVKLLATKLEASENGAQMAEEAIMTTDTLPKQIAYEFIMDNKVVHIGGMCKGSGMIHPNMCTLLAYITTDIAISKEMLTKAVKADVKDTFNMISVDGDTSTNDTMLVLSNGAAMNSEITSENEDYKVFCKVLNMVNTYLAKKMAGDGEGATALFEVKMINAKTKEQAVTLSKSVVSSSLTKAAIYGHDANWGRIICAMGYSGANFNPEIIDLYFESKAGKIKIAENGVTTDFSEENAKKILSEEEITAIVDLKQGTQQAIAWGCDLTYDYVKINADYRS